MTLELAALSPTLASRVVADSRDRVAWTRARSRGITATDVASLTSVNAIAKAADAKLMGSGFSGNAYTAHGRVREPAIAGWVAATHGILPSSALFHAVVEKRHLATPDGVVVDADGRITLCEIKTTNKSWRSIPRTYLRQIWWQQHVLEAERTLVVWEEHDGFVPVDDEPRCAWVDRDDARDRPARGSGHVADRRAPPAHDAATAGRPGGRRADAAPHAARALPRARAR